MGGIGGLQHLIYVYKFPTGWHGVGKKIIKIYKINVETLLEKTQDDLQCGTGSKCPDLMNIAKKQTIGFGS